MAEIKLFSLIVPAYNQEASLMKDINNIQKVLKDAGLLYEMIIVDDGSNDTTYKIAQFIKPLSKRGTIIPLSYRENKGKGYAIKYGISKARGDSIGFIDAGMDINPKAIPQLLDYLKQYNADIVVGSKIHKDSKVKYPAFRRILSGGYQTINQILFGFSVRDTQVGLKIFKGKVAKKIFNMLGTNRFAFDIEVLTLASLLGYKVIEAPVNVKFKKEGSITSANFWLVVFQMLGDTGLVFYKLKSGRYYDKIHK